MLFFKLLTTALFYSHLTIILRAESLIRPLKSDKIIHVPYFDRSVNINNVINHI